MNNLVFNIKKFLSNKNTVTILGVILAITILYIGYNYRISEAIQPVKMPYAKVTIQPRTKITVDMIGYVEVPPSMLMGKVIKSASLVVGKYSNYNTLIPLGSLFFTNTVIEASDLPDSSLVSIPEGYTAFNLPVDIESSYGNSIFPDNYINLYFKAYNEEGKIMVGMLAKNIKVLAVKDKAGKNVFENSDDERISSTIIFAVPEDIHLLLRKAMYLETTKGIEAELIPVPNTESYTSEVGAISITSTYLKEFIELNTGLVPEDALPDVTDTTTVE
ncbi:MAG: hypothetical protein PHQ89_02600 [Bacilli bacterium]|nr:hypothetical protein [Bacilli bacterium]